jgi:hypothetical protein
MMANDVEHDSSIEASSPDMEWRRERFAELGFSGNESLALANSKQASYTGGKDNSKRIEWQTPLDWKKVKVALDSGCSPSLALEIFITVD